MKIIRKHNKKKIIKKKQIIELNTDPKTENRFIVQIKNKKGKQILPPYVIKHVERPKLSIRSDKSIVYHSIHMICYDPVDPSTSNAIMECIRNNDILWDINVKILGPKGNAVEEWEISDALLEYIDFGNFDWERTATPASVYLSVLPKWAKLKY